MRPSEPDYAKASPFESLLQDEGAAGSGRFIPPLAKGDHSWMSKPLPASVFSKGEQKCLATAIYFEARGESLRGQAAVAQVVLNRVRNPTYPSTICGVVYQNDHLRNRCQFSFACDGIKDRITSRANYQMAQDIAMAVTAGKIFLPEVGFVDPLLCDLRQSALGSLDAEDEEDRPAHLLSHLWRRLELNGRGDCRNWPSRVASQRFRERGQYVALS